MKSFKHGSALIAGVAALIFSQTIGSSAAAATCKSATPITDAILDDPVMIQKFLTDNKLIRTAPDFVACLPAVYREENWIMMSLSQSLQSGTAEYPRFILTNKKSTKVFGLELPTNPKANAPDEIEYLRFDGAEKKFRFYSIVTNIPEVIKNQNADGKDCRTCHFGNPRPNWDAYDSWGGMLPFNRDRVYESATVNFKIEESVESKAIERIFTKLLKTKPDALFTQLKLPDGIEQDPKTGKVQIKFPATGIEPPFFYDGGTGESVPVDYTQDENKHVVYPGGSVTLVEQGGTYLRLNSSSKPPTSDEGRGVALFDNFTIGPPRPNPLRIARSILDYMKDPAVVDVRYVALGIANQALGQVGFEKCITADTLGKFAPKEDLDKLLAFQTTINPKVTDFPSLRDDTDTRRKSLPQLKANLESQNLEALIKANGDVFTPDRVNANIAHRSTYGGPSQDVPFATDSILGWMIDRELYGNGDTPTLMGGNQNTTIALFRLYLEPLPANDKGVSLPVNRWSMSVRTTAKLGPAEPVNSRARNNTYTFGDLLSQYTTQLQSTLTGVLGNLSCSDLAAGSIKAFNAATNKE